MDKNGLAVVPFRFAEPAPSVNSAVGEGTLKNVGEQVDALFKKTNKANRRFCVLQNARAQGLIL